MNYKEQIEYYRNMAKRWEQGEQLLLNGELRMQDTLREFADTIETLLAERDAAIADLKWFAESVYNPYPCDLCIHCPSDGSICTKMSEDCWQWRGPQKHD